MSAGIYYALDGLGYPLLKTNGSIDKVMVDKLAIWDVVVLDIWPVTFRPDILTELRESNPNIKLIAYVMGCTYDIHPWSALGTPSAEFMYQFGKIVEETRGHLHTYQPSQINVNLSNHYCAIALGQHIASHMNNWDGIFLDVWCPEMTPGQTWIEFSKNTPPLVEPEFNQAWNMGFKKMRDAIRLGTNPSFPIIGNYGPGPSDPTNINGWTRENVFRQNGGTWWANMIENQWKQRGYMHDEREYHNPYSILAANPFGGGKDNPSNIQLHRFTFGSSLLGKGTSTFYRGEYDKTWMADHANWWFPEYEIDFGPVYSIPMTWQGTEVWYREYDKGAVLVNPTDHSISVYGLPLMHPAHGGAAKKDWNVPLYDSLFLLK